MGLTYDNWERLVVAVMRREQLRSLSLIDSSSPSTRSFDSDYSFSSGSWHDYNLSFRPTPSTLHHPNVAVKLKLTKRIWKGLSVFGGFSSKKMNSKWANERKTLPGIEQIKVAEELRLADEAKRSAEITRLQELHTLKGHIRSLLKTKGRAEMGRTYDNWERLVEAVLRREQLRDLCLSDSMSLKSDLSSSTFSSSRHDSTEIQLSKSGGLSFNKDYGTELETEFKWAKDRKYENVFPTAEEAKRRAEIARLEELPTLKGQINSLVKAKGLRIFNKSLLQLSSVNYNV